MRTGVKIEANELVLSISCSKCHGRLLFPAKFDRNDMVSKAKTRHGWHGEGRDLYCDGCAERHGLTKSKASKPKPKPKEEPTEVDDDGCIELGE